MRRRRARTWLRPPAAAAGALVLALGAAPALAGLAPVRHRAAPAVSGASPDWLKHAVIYEILPDRFFDAAIQDNENPATRRGVGTGPSGSAALVPIAFHSDWSSIPYDPDVAVPPPGSPGYAAAKAIYGDGQWNLDFFGGNIPGITRKLAYLQSLGVNTLYLTPIFEADTNHKYDTANFKLVDPGFGTLKDFRALIHAADARGMHVILDGVFEDTGSDSVYFNQFGSYRSVGAWQEFRDPAERSPYWSFYLQDPAYKNPFMTWNGVSTLMLTNDQSRAWQHFVYGAHDKSAPLDPQTNSVAAYWLDLGVSGWRLDSADSANLSPAWWQAFRAAVKRLDPQAAIIGEIWPNPTDDSGVDWLTNDTFDSVTNYPLQQALLGFLRGTYNAGSETFTALSAQGLMAAIEGMAKSEPPQAFYAMMNLIDSQDTMRALTVLEDAPPPGVLSTLAQALWRPTAAQLRLGEARLRLLTDMQFTLPGAPTIWYGDEAGVGGYSDPFDRATYPWGHANLRVLDHYRLLGALHTSLPALATGTFAPLYARGAVLAYLRQIRGGRDVFGEREPDASVITVINNRDVATTVHIDLAGRGLAGVRFRDLLAPDAPAFRARGHTLTVPLGPLQGRILVAGPATPVAWLTQPGQRSDVLTWTPVPGAAAYTVRLSEPGAAGRTVRVRGHALDLTGDLAPVALTATVAARGLVSEPVTVPARSLTPPVVTARDGAGALHVSWTAVRDASAYAVYLSTPAGGWHLVATQAATRWTGAPPYAGVEVRVAAENAGDYAPSAAVRPVGD